MRVTYLPVYETEELFDFNRHNESVCAMVCMRSPIIAPPRLAQMRFRLEDGAIIHRYINMFKTDPWNKMAAFVAHELWCDTERTAKPINGAIIWKPLTKAEAETLNAVGVPLYYTNDSF